ncbi:unnamed protein product [Lactuca saligna]|uniref:Uncharacterized protein n=1 Tax=Lactuca saligna TaxID=75948 RepID=A0AA36EE25_LACSI|nr:unnamed protein product [Lactuca saligna]
MLPINITTNNKDISRRRHLDAPKYDPGHKRRLLTHGSRWGSHPLYLHTPNTSVQQAIFLLVLCIAHHSNRIGVMDTELFLLRMDLMNLEMAPRIITRSSQGLQVEQDAHSAQSNPPLDHTYVRK